MSWRDWLKKFRKEGEPEPDWEGQLQECLERAQRAEGQLEHHEKRREEFGRTLRKIRDAISEIDPTPENGTINTTVTMCEVSNVQIEAWKEAAAQRNEEAKRRGGWVRCCVCEGRHFKDECTMFPTKRDGEWVQMHICEDCLEGMKDVAGEEVEQEG